MLYKGRLEDYNRKKKASNPAFLIIRYFVEKLNQFNKLDIEY